MVDYLRVALSASIFALMGCASVKQGDKSTEAALKRFAAIPGKVSLYVCREQALSGAAITAVVVVDGVPIGALKPNMFAHVVLEAGVHEVFLRRDGLEGDSGILRFRAMRDDVAFVWVGRTGGGWGVITVDYFASTAEGMQCVAKATYSVRSD